jgi:hypothetical protein
VVLGRVLHHHQTVGQQLPAHVLDLDRVTIGVRRPGHQLGSSGIADLASGAAELVEVGCEQPLKTRRAGAALKAQRLVLGGHSLGDLPVSSTRFDDLARTTMLSENLDMVRAEAADTRQ